MRSAPSQNTRRCLLRFAALISLGFWFDWSRIDVRGATAVLDAAQVTRQFFQRSWQKQDGLPDDTVQSLLQTRDGFLWVGTRNGLARFDGVKFVRVDLPLQAEEKRDYSTSMAEDLDGNLWVVVNGELWCGRGGVFKSITSPSGGLYDDATAVFADHRGSIWIASESHGVDRITNGKIDRFGKAEGFLSPGAFGFLEDSTGTLWTSGGDLHYFNEHIGRFERVSDDRDVGVLRTYPKFLQCDGDGGFWCLGHRPGQANAWELTHFRDGLWDRVERVFPRGVRKGFLTRDHRGNLWMASGEGGLDCLQDAKWTRYSLPAEFSREFILCLMEDREGNLWFGTEYSGLHCWKPRAVTSLSVRDGLAHDTTWTICEAHDRSVWIGTEEGLSHHESGRLENYHKRDGWSGDKIRSVAEDISGAIWVGTSSGLSVIRNGRIERVAYPHPIERDKIRVVLPARDGTLWLGNVEGLYHLANGGWRKFSPTNGLANEDVRALHEDKQGSLWIGTAGGGLQCFRDGQFTTWTTTNGLSNNSVWAFHEDVDGVLWIGTEKGLNRFKDGRFIVFTTREGLPVDPVNEILEDDWGYLWVSHDYGIYRVRKAELNDLAAGRTHSIHAVRYTEADGLPTNETNGQKSQPAGCKTRDGRLWFPTPKGVVVIDPRMCDRDAIAPQAIVESVRADGKLVYDSAASMPGAVQAVAENTGGTPVQLNLPPGSGRVLELRYTAPVFTAPEQTTFRYRLVGAGDEWVEAGTRREAYFSGLRRGGYRFELLAANHRGVWSPQTTSFAFTLQPFYYQTWWFYSGGGLGAALLIAGVVRWRLLELRKLHVLEQQSAIAAERERLAKDLHDGLGADLTRLTLLANLISEQSGADEKVRKLSQSSRSAVRELKELIWIANPTDGTVDGLVSQICQTAEDFLGDARIRCRLDVTPDLPQSPLSLEQRRNVLLVAREALNNIVKHAAATEVYVRARAEDRVFYLAIEDNGRGFDPASARPDGLGLASMRRRVEKLGGSFELHSRLGAGTRILITLKLGKPQ